MKTNLAATTRNLRTHLLGRCQLVTLAILLAQASAASAATFVKATYNGLFSEINETNAVVNPLSSGFLTLSVRESGSFSGKLQISDGTSTSGAKYALSGQFDADGKQTLSIARKAAAGGPLNVELQYASAGQNNIITGRVLCTNWTAELLAYQAYSSQPPAAGTYTVRFSSSEPDNGPDGVGAGMLSVSLSGKLSFSAKLPEGTSFSQSLNLCMQGRWPLYASLYKGQGSILGWVEFSGSDSLSGEIGWTKPAMPTSKYYSQGFTNVLDLQGLAFIARRSGSRPLNFSKGLVIFSGGGLLAPFTNTVNLSTSGHLNDNTSNDLSFKINPLTGLFSGKAELPGFHGHVPVNGTIFQSHNEGYGYFLLNGQSGAVLLSGDYR